MNILVRLRTLNNKNDWVDFVYTLTYTSKPTLTTIVDFLLPKILDKPEFSLLTEGFIDFKQSSAGTKIDDVLPFPAFCFTVSKIKYTVANTNDWNKIEFDGTQQASDCELNFFFRHMFFGFNTHGDQKVDYKLIPNDVQSVIIVGKNGSGKSTLLAKQKLQPPIDPLRHPKTQPRTATKGNSRAEVKSDVSIVAYHGKLNDYDEKTVKALETVDLGLLRRVFRDVVTCEWSVHLNEKNKPLIYFTRYSMQPNCNGFAEISWESASDGLRQIVRILLRTFSNDLYIVIDEIENSLHHSAAVSLIRNLKIEASKRNKLVVCTTHSLPILKEFHGERNCMILYLSSDIPKNCKHVLKAGATSKSPESEVIFSEISCQLVSSNPFLSLPQNSFENERLSAEMVLELANIKPVVLCCEGKESSHDGKILNAIVDLTRVEVRDMDNCVMVASTVQNMNNARSLRTAIGQNIEYYGIIDADRHYFGSSDKVPKGVFRWRVAESENLFWCPDMLRAYNNVFMIAKGAGKTDNVVTFNSRLHLFLIGHLGKIIKTERVWMLFEFASQFSKDASYYYSSGNDHAFNMDCESSIGNNFAALKLYGLLLSGPFKNLKDMKNKDEQQEVVDSVKVICEQNDCHFGRCLLKVIKAHQTILDLCIRETISIDDFTPIIEEALMSINSKGVLQSVRQCFFDRGTWKWSFKNARITELSGTATFEDFFYYAIHQEKWLNRNIFGIYNALVSQMDTFLSEKLQLRKLT